MSSINSMNNDEVKAAVTILTMWLEEKRKLFMAMLIINMVIEMILFTIASTPEQLGLTLIALILVNALHLYFQSGVTKEVKRCVRVLKKLGLSDDEIKTYMNPQQRE